MFKNIKTAQDLELEAFERAANSVRAQRDDLLSALSKDIERHQSQSRLGIEVTHTIENLDHYAQLLRDIPAQAGFPFEIVWPEL
tara:strand:+ start:140 stop:391 length:252 start_codon:yes stop_codon:yes gene_type:complete